MPGKLPPELLEALVLRWTGYPDSSIIVGPAIGEDAGVVRLPGGWFLVVHSDPITEAESRIGWLAVHVASNDVAVTGARPRWASVTILLPEGSPPELASEIARDVDAAAYKLRVAIIGGHTEWTPGLEKPVVVATVAGVTRRPVPTSGVLPGDELLVVKPVALEGTAIIAHDFAWLLEGKVPRSIIERAKRFFEEISVVEEALSIADLVDSMHDVTEGGLLGAVYEAARASGLCADLYEERVPVREETRVIADAIGVDPLRLIGSGSFIAAVPRSRVGEVLSRLRGVEANVAGRFYECSRPVVRVRRVGGRVEVVGGFVEDEISRLWRRAKNSKTPS